jgi:hypothetical protein
MDIKAKEYRQVSAFPHAYNDTPYRKVMGKSGKAWFYKPGKFAATAIYVDGGKGSQGFGGQTLQFKLEDGTTFDSAGPWMTTAENMLADTGVDLRDQQATRVIISRKVHYPKNIYAFMPDMIDVVYYEEQFVEGRFERAKEKVREIVKETGESLHYFIESFGGAQCGMMKPEDV